MSEDVKAELERLKAENEALKSKKPERGTLSMKVSEKGALSIYGMGRFPVTLYKEQWLKLLGIADEIKTFIKENDNRLKTKEKGWRKSCKQAKLSCLTRTKVLDSLRRTTVAKTFLFTPTIRAALS